MQKSEHRDGRPRSRLNWDDVRVFAAVAIEGGINKAAAVLKLTPATVTRHIKDLERRLATRLFDRHKTGMTLTDAGKDLFELSQPMRRSADTIERTMRGRDRRDEGPVTISAPDGIGSLWVAPRIGEFLSRNPRIQVALDCRVGPPPENALRTDITIAAELDEAQVGDDTSLLATMHYVLLASPAYLETYGKPKSAASAAGDHRTLKHTGQIAQSDNWGKRAKALSALAEFSFVTNSSAALVESVRGGAGVAIAPTYLLKAHPELVIIGDEKPVPIKLWLVVREEVRETARVLRAAEWLKSIFDARSNPWFESDFVAPEQFFTERARPVAREKKPPKRRRPSTP